MPGEIDFSHFPGLPPATVARVTEDGLPTKETIDWDQLQRDWFKRTAVDLQTKINTVESTTDANTAAITTETTARTSADTAIAATVTTAQATANGATASGQVYLIAESAPTGYSAQYGWTLTAGLHSIGMKALVDGAGDGYIGFVASKFFLIDPSYLGGAPVTVFDYNGTTFNFNVPVTVRNQEIGANAVSNQAATVADVASGASLSVTMTTLASTRILIVCSACDSSTTSVRTSSGGSSVATFRQYDLYIDSVITSKHFYAYDQIISTAFTGLAGGNAWQFQIALSPAIDSFIITGLSAGSHSFSLVNPNSFTTHMSMTVTELRDG